MPRTVNHCASTAARRGGAWPRFCCHTRELGLDVLRIQYGLPGFIDLVGVGKVVEHVRLFIENLIDLRARRQRERLENEGLAQDIGAKKIENARNLIRLTGEARDVGPSDDDLRYLLYEIDGAQERLLRQIERGNVTSVGPAPPPEAGPDRHGDGLTRYASRSRLHQGPASHLLEVLDRVGPLLGCAYDIPLPLLLGGTRVGRVVDVRGRVIPGRRAAASTSAAPPISSTSAISRSTLSFVAPSSITLAARASFATIDESAVIEPAYTTACDSCSNRA